MIRRFRSLFALCTLCAVLLLLGCGDGHQQHASLTMDARTVSLRAVTGTPWTGLNLDLPRWVAFQDGDGPWQRLLPDTTTRYLGQVHDPQGRYSFAVAREFDSATYVTIYHATLSEMREIVSPVQRTTTPTAVTITVTGLSADERALVNDFFYDPVGNGTYTAHVIPGTYDLLGLVSTTAQPAVATRMLLRRNVAVLAADELTVDFSGAAPVSGVTHAATLQGDPLYAEVTCFTPRHAGLTLARTSYPVTQPTLTYAALPLASDSGDGYTVEAYFENNSAHAVSFTEPADQTIAMPPSFMAQAEPPVIASGLQYPATTWSTYPNAACYYFRTEQPVDGTTIRWTAMVSAGWLGDARQFTMPNLSGAAGWNAAWGLRADQPLAYWEAQADTLNQPLPALFADPFYERTPLGMDVTWAWSGSRWATDTRSASPAHRPTSHRAVWE